MKTGGCGNSPAKDLAFIAVTCALLLGGQYVFSFVVGVEIVTLLLVCFSSVFGARRGAILAVAFSLLRCFIFGFTPAVLVLYLIYYPALAFVFGGLGRLKTSSFGSIGVAVAVNALLVLICSACALCYACGLIKVSQLYKVTVDVLLWVIFAVCAIMLAVFDCLLLVQKRFKKYNGEMLRVIALTATACVCTVCFTLLDDVITPLFTGMGGLSALGYFYASFLAMLPQTVCTAISVSALFLSLTDAMSRFSGRKFLR